MSLKKGVSGVRCRGSPRTSSAGPSVMWSAVAERSGDTALPEDDPCRPPPGSSFPETKAALSPPHSKGRLRATLSSRHGFGSLHRPNHAPLGSPGSSLASWVLPRGPGRPVFPRKPSWSLAIPGARPLRQTRYFLGSPRPPEAGMSVKKGCSNGVGGPVCYVECGGRAQRRHRFAQG